MHRLQSAIKFINLTAPSSAGRIGMNLRFLQRMGALPRRVIRGWRGGRRVQDDGPGRLFLLAIPFVGFDLDKSRCRGAASHVASIAIAVALGSGVIAIVRAESAGEGRPADPHGVLGTLEGGQDRRKRVQMFGGEAVRALYVLALGATCLAYGVNLNLAQLIFINMSAAVLSELIPVPGGIGAAEAALSAGLISMGVDKSTAFAIALTQRLCTFYLPPIWGYVVACGG